jgi:hypothetical protein
LAASGDWRIFFVPWCLSTVGIAKDTVLNRDNAFATVASAHYRQPSFASRDAAQREYELNLKSNQ